MLSKVKRKLKKIFFSLCHKTLHFFIWDNYRGTNFRKYLFLKHFYHVILMRQYKSPLETIIRLQIKNISFYKKFQVTFTSTESQVAEYFVRKINNVFISRYSHLDYTVLIQAKRTAQELNLVLLQLSHKITCYKQLYYLLNSSTVTVADCTGLAGMELAFFTAACMVPFWICD